jgi:hypothetical protein
MVVRGQGLSHGAGSSFSPAIPDAAAATNKVGWVSLKYYGQPQLQKTVVLNSLPKYVRL